MLDDLYQDIILDHSRHPRHAGLLEKPDAEARGYNPMCGDEVSCGLLITDNTIVDICCAAKGCAISVAAASIMSELVNQHSIAEASQLAEGFIQMVTTGTKSPVALGKAEAFAGVKQFPMRVKCATLAWHALKEALGQYGK